MVFFPGSDAIHESSSKDLSTWVFDFIVRSGRAVVHPIYKSTYERQDSLRSDYPDESNFYKEHVIAWAKDMPAVMQSRRFSGRGCVVPSSQSGAPTTQPKSPAVAIASGGGGRAP